MKKSIVSFSAFILLAVAAFAWAAASWSIDSPNSKVNFTIVNMGMNVEGTFQNAKGNINFDPNDLGNSSINASVETATVNTGITMRDNHLKKYDYFDVEKYPEITFQSTSIEASGDSYVVVGDFTIRDVTKSVRIPFTFNNNTFIGSFSVNRLDYGVGESSWVMKSDVKIDFELPVVAR